MMNWRMPRRVACFVILAVTFSALCLAAQEAPRLELTAKSAVLMDYASGEGLRHDAPNRQLASPK